MNSLSTVTHLTSAIVYLIIYVVLLAFAMRYLLAKRFMTYHAQAVGKEWEQIDVRQQMLIRALLKTAGGGMLAASVTGLLLAMQLLLVSDGLGRFIAPLPALLFGLSVLHATTTLKRQTGAPTPVRACIALLFSTLFAFALSMI